MQYRRFGRTNLKIPVLSLGGMRFQKSWDQLDFSEVSYEEQNKVEILLIQMNEEKDILRKMREKKCTEKT